MRHPRRAVGTLVILALIPSLMAITILFPADADPPGEGSVDTPSTLRQSSAPAVGETDFEVTLETGTVVVLSGSVISAKTVTATTTTTLPGDPTD